MGADTQVRNYVMCLRRGDGIVDLIDGQFAVDCGQRFGYAFFDIRHDRTERVAGIHYVHGHYRFPICP